MPAAGGVRRGEGGQRLEKRARQLLRPPSMSVMVGLLLLLLPLPPLLLLPHSLLPLPPLLLLLLLLLLLRSPLLLFRLFPQCSPQPPRTPPPSVALAGPAPSGGGWGARGPTLGLSLPR
jgi:hypothetical protein